jgi:hypothetical protein
MKKKIIIISCICFVFFLTIFYFSFYKKKNKTGKDKSNTELKYHYIRPKGSIFEESGKEWMLSSRSNKMNWIITSEIDTLNPVDIIRVNSTLTSLEYYYMDAGRLIGAYGLSYFKKGYTWNYEHCDSCYSKEIEVYKLPQSATKVYIKYHDKLKNKGKLITTNGIFERGNLTMNIFEIIEKREYLISVVDGTKRYLILYMNKSIYYFKNTKKPVFDADYVAILKSKGLVPDK